MIMVLKESYLANLGNLPSESIKLNVTRSAGHLLSPSVKLLVDYKEKRVDWNTFCRRYKQEMDNEGCRKIMMIIKNLSIHEDVYLLCLEKSGNCHRHILMEMINLMCRWCGETKKVSTGLCPNCCRF